MEERQKMRIVTGAMILVALGALFLLDVIGLYKFDKSWPILLIVVAILSGMLSLGVLKQSQPADLLR